MTRKAPIFLPALLWLLVRLRLPVWRWQPTRLQMMTPRLYCQQSSPDRIIVISAGKPFRLPVPKIGAESRSRAGGTMNLRALQVRIGKPPSEDTARTSQADVEVLDLRRTKAEHYKQFQWEEENKASATAPAAATSGQARLCPQRSPRRTRKTMPRSLLQKSRSSSSR